VLGEREGFERGPGGIARAILKARPHAKRPQRVKARLQDAKGRIVRARYDDKILVRHHRRRQPDENAVLGDFRCRDEARQSCNFPFHVCR